MKVRDILTDKSKWCKGAYARTASGKRTTFQSEEARRFCLQGAIYRASNGDAKKTVRVEDKVLKKLGGAFGITYWNDTRRRTFAEVRALIEELDI